MVMEKSRMPLMASLLIAAVLFCGVQVTEGGLNAERRIFDYIFGEENNYSPLVRPVANYGDTLTVSYGLALIYIDEMNESTNDITLSVWERMLWRDTGFSWDPRDFEGVYLLRIPSDLIWKPDIVLFNSLDVDVQRNKALAVVSSDGTVLWIPMTKIRTRCEPDGDEWYCRLKFSSWTYDGYKVDVNFYDALEQIDLFNYVESPDYEVTSSSAERHEGVYPCCDEPYPDLTFTLVLKKR